MSDQTDRHDHEQHTSRTAEEQPSGPGQEPLDEPGPDTSPGPDDDVEGPRGT